MTLSKRHEWAGFDLLIIFQINREAEAWLGAPVDMEVVESESFIVRDKRSSFLILFFSVCS